MLNSARSPAFRAAPDVDVHSFVLKTLDGHLAVLLDVRVRPRRRGRPCPAPACGWSPTATSAHRYLSRLDAVLSTLSAR
jgi:hypothetical protein